MGRLENAMRRAAGEQAAPAVDLPQPAEDFADDLPNEVAPPVLESGDAAVEPGYFPNELAPVNGLSGQGEIAKRLLEAVAKEARVPAKPKAVPALPKAKEARVSPKGKKEKSPKRKA